MKMPPWNSSSWAPNKDMVNQIWLHVNTAWNLTQWALIQIHICLTKYDEKWATCCPQKSNLDLNVTITISYRRTFQCASKGTFQKRFSGIRPLRGGWGYPPFPLRKKTFFFSDWFSVKRGGGGYPLNGRIPLKRKWQRPLHVQFFNFLFVWKMSLVIESYWHSSEFQSSIFFCKSYFWSSVI